MGAATVEVSEGQATLTRSDVGQERLEIVLPQAGAPRAVTPPPGSAARAAGDDR